MALIAPLITAAEAEAFAQSRARLSTCMSIAAVLGAPSLTAMSARSASRTVSSSSLCSSAER